jgi:hypothetical protein
MYDKDVCQCFGATSVLMIEQRPISTSSRRINMESEKKTVLDFEFEYGYLHNG